MKAKHIIIGFICLMAHFSCKKINKSHDKKEHSLSVSEPAQNYKVKDIVVKKDSILELVSECKNNLYRAKLEEYIARNKDAFVLTINPNRGKRKIHTLNLRPGRTKMLKCTPKYVLLSSACGGPCYGYDFIFLDDNRKPETYQYCNIATSNESIISYVKNEEFENLLVHNLKNGKEVKINLNHCENSNAYPCEVINIDVFKNTLKLEFGTSNDSLKQKSFNIAKILN